jgi:hypothetical protein
MREFHFSSEILLQEVVVTHLATGHLYRFPILPNGTASLNGARIEERPGSTINAKKFLFEAHDVARITVRRANGLRRT